MSDTPHVAAVCGSLRDQSKTRVAARTALESASEAGADTTLVDLRTYDLPPYDADDGDAGDAPRLREVVDSADAVLLATPNYHGTFSGALKSALDYLGRDEFRGQTVGLLVVAGGSYPASPLGHLRTVCRTLNAWTLPVEVAIPDSGSTIGDERIRDDGVRQRVRELGAELNAYAGVDGYPETRPTETEAVTGD